MFLVNSPQKRRHGPCRVEHSGDHGNLGYNELRHDSGARHEMFCEESLGKVNAKDLELFRNRLVHEFYCLKVLITLEQVVKKKKNLNEQNLDQWYRWCG